MLNVIKPGNPEIYVIPTTHVEKVIAYLMTKASKEPIRYNNKSTKYAYFSLKQTYEFMYLHLSSWFYYVIAMLLDPTTIDGDFFRKSKYLIV